MESLNVDEMAERYEWAPSWCPGVQQVSCLCEGVKEGWLLIRAAKGGYAPYEFEVFSADDVYGGVIASDWIAQYGGDQPVVCVGFNEWNGIESYGMENVNREESK